MRNLVYGLVDNQYILNTVDPKIIESQFMHVLSSYDKEVDSQGDKENGL